MTDEQPETTDPAVEPETPAEPETTAPEVVEPAESPVEPEEPATLEANDGDTAFDPSKD